MRAAWELAETIGSVAACREIGVSRASLHRFEKPRAKRPLSYRKSFRALSCAEREAVMGVLHSERFLDMAPEAIVATLAEEGVFLCSPRTMYRLLAEHGEVKERRNQARHPHYQKPELLATGPHQVWSWDITKLKGPHKGQVFYLYVILDIFSRYGVAWTVATRESEDLAEELIARACKDQGITAGELTIHADRGAAMTSKTVAQLLSDLGVVRSHSRPSVSNDNPYSEAQFKTLKYRPDFPERFPSLEQARAHCAAFFAWYNHEHRHSGIDMLTPASLHYGQAEVVLDQRYCTMQQAYAEHPERFARPPRRHHVPAAVWINSPGGDQATSD